jgi:hypothetical protein
MPFDGNALDFPLLTNRPLLRTILIVGLCLLGLVFSATGVVIACGRLRLGRSERSKQPL